jgi:hypothetical protein
MSIPSSYSEYYGDETRWFIGIVVNVNDPLQLGRVQVRIHGIHSASTIDIPLSDLPWAQTVIPVTEGGVSGLGANVGIKPKSQVFGIFLDGKNSQLPLVMGSIPKIETLTATETKDRKILDITTDNTPAERTSGISLTADDTAALSTGTYTPSVSTTGAPSTVKTNSRGRKVYEQCPIDRKLPGQSNAEKAFTFFLTPEGGGYSPLQSAGIVGNLLQESSYGGDIQPAIVNSIGATGIAQWLNTKWENRRDNMKNFAAERNIPWFSVIAQCLFIKYELDTFGYFGKKQLLNAKSLDEATEVFCLKFERPGKHEANIPKRQKYARELLEKMENP